VKELQCATALAITNKINIARVYYIANIDIIYHIANISLISFVSVW
jgi:hypothetical protein